MKTIKIVIADDIEDNRIILKNILNKIEDVKVFEAINGREAVDIVQREAIDIVLTDIIMPELDGIEASKQIRQINPDIIIIAVTAVSDPQVDSAMQALGASAYIIKPIDRNVVGIKIRNFIEQARVRKEKMLFKNSSVINLFSDRLRCYKTYFHIRTEDEIMDFGTWLIEFYNRVKSTPTFSFNRMLDVLYKMLYLKIREEQVMIVVAEEDFECLYLTFITGEMNTLDADYYAAIAEDVAWRDKMMSVRIRITDESGKIEPLKPEAVVEPATDSVVVSPEPVPETVSRKLDDQQRQLLSQSMLDEGIIDASAYIESLGDDLPEEVYDLEEYTAEWGGHLRDLEHAFRHETLEALADTVYRIASFVNKLYDFNTLGYALSSLAVYIREVDAQKIDESNKRKFIILNGGVNEDIKQWILAVFIERTANNIHYLDSSLYSSCLQIETMLSDKEEEYDTDDLELF